MQSSIILRLKLSKLLWKNSKILHNSFWNLSSSKFHNYYSICNNVVSSNFYTFHHRKPYDNSLLCCAYSTKPQSNYNKISTSSNLKDKNNLKAQKQSKDDLPESVELEQPQQSQQKNQEDQKDYISQGDLLQNKKLGLFTKFKLMYKQYWYVLIPVHVITSIGWFGGFYYLSKSGVDIPSLLQSLHISESIIDKLRGSEMGHIAVAYLCYKIATPARYAVTVGGTTISIKHLVQAGYIKPMPTKDELIKMYEDRKEKRKQEKESKN